MTTGEQAREEMKSGASLVAPVVDRKLQLHQLRHGNKYMPEGGSPDFDIDPEPQFSDDGSLAKEYFDRSVGTKISQRRVGGRVVKEFHAGGMDGQVWTDDKGHIRSEYTTYWVCRNDGWGIVKGNSAKATHGKFSVERLADGVVAAETRTQIYINGTLRGTRAVPVATSLSDEES